MTQAIQRPFPPPGTSLTPHPGAGSSISSVHTEEQLQLAGACFSRTQTSSRVLLLQKWYYDVVFIHAGRSQTATLYLLQKSQRDEKSHF